MGSLKDGFSFDRKKVHLWLKLKSRFFTIWRETKIFDVKVNHLFAASTKMKPFHENIVALKTIS